MPDLQSARRTIRNRDCRRWRSSHSEPSPSNVPTSLEDFPIAGIDGFICEAPGGSIVTVKIGQNIFPIEGQELRHAPKPLARAVQSNDHIHDQPGEPHGKVDAHPQPYRS